MGAHQGLCTDWARRGAAPVLWADDGTVWSHAELDARASAWARGLQAAGLRPGDRVAALLEPGAEAIAAMLGALRAGAAWVPINTRYREGERDHILHDSGARLCLVEGGDATLGPRARLADGPAGVPALPPTNALSVPESAGSLLIYTSGTTGPSKGVELPPDAVARGIGALTEAWRFGPGDVLSLALPLFHVHGLCIGVFGALLSGAAIRLHARFDPARVVAGFEVDPPATVFLGVPTMYVALLEHLRAHPEGAAALRRGRLFTAGSAALRPAVLAELEALTGHRILERYGMTETLISLSNPLDGERRAGAVGLPVPGYAIRIVDEQGEDLPTGAAGELWVRGPGMMRGYWGQPGPTAAAFSDGWFRTGDMASQDDDGYVRIVGRLSVDIIKSGGFKIAAGEIEEVLRTHPDVRDAAVVGVDDPRWGERIAAAVQLQPGAAARDWTAELSELVASRLADYKKPRQVLVVDELPRNALGKVVKPALRERFSGTKTGAKRQL